MGGFKQNQTRDILYGFRDEIMHWVSGDTVRSRRQVYEGEVDIGVTLKRDQVSAREILMKLFTEV